jgi:AraC-like DNA-binding protein
MSKAILEYSIINGIILAFILLYKKRSLISAKYFLLLYLVFLAAIAEQLYIAPIFINTWYTYSEFPIRFLFSPLFFLYVATYLNPKYRPGKKMTLFLVLPTVADVLCCIIITVLAINLQLDLKQRVTIVNNQALYLTRSILAVGYSLYLTIRVLQLIRNFTREVRDVYASTKKVQFQWLKSISIVNVVLWSVWLGYIVAECFQPISRHAYIPLFVLLSLVIIVQGYFVVLKPDMAFEFNQANTEIEENHLPEEKKEEEKSFPEETTEENDKLGKLFERLEVYMDAEKAYANNNLSLSVIAADLQQSAPMITKAIRHGYNDSFYNYVNRFRAKKFLEELAKPENDMFTIDTLSVKCGFNSKATLHKYFKELTGLTPAIVQKKLRSGEETTGSITKSTGNTQP